jgi:hypothetical protein
VVIYEGFEPYESETEVWVSIRNNTDFKYLVDFSSVSGKLGYSRAQSCEVVGKRTYLQLIDNVMRRVRMKENYLELAQKFLQPRCRK